MQLMVQVGARCGPGLQCMLLLLELMHQRGQADVCRRVFMLLLLLLLLRVLEKLLLLLIVLLLLLLLLEVHLQRLLQLHAGGDLEAGCQLMHACLLQVLRMLVQLVLQLQCVRLLLQLLDLVCHLL